MSFFTGYLAICRISAYKAVRAVLTADLKTHFTSPMPINLGQKFDHNRQIEFMGTLSIKNISTNLIESYLDEYSTDLTRFLCNGMLRSHSILSINDIY